MIGILSSGTENLSLVKLLEQHGLPYTVIMDNEYRPYHDKSCETLLSRVEYIMTEISKKGVTQRLLPPALELSLLQQNPQRTDILPIFSNYLQYSLNHSLVGKIGWVGGYSDISQIESLWKTIATHYQPTEKQQTTKKFHLSKWTKDTSMWSYLTRSLSPRTMIVNTMIKFDLKYYKDAGVDTIIPLNYSYFAYQKTITSFFNQKKQKFHKRDILKEMFQKTMTQKTLGTLETLGTLQLYHTGSLHFITEHKKWERLLSQGGQYTIEYHKIEL